MIGYTMRKKTNCTDKLSYINVMHRVVVCGATVCLSRGNLDFVDEANSIWEKNVFVVSSFGPDSEQFPGTGQSKSFSLGWEGSCSDDRLLSITLS